MASRQQDSTTTDSDAARALRARERRARISAHRATSWADATQWDLEFWQQQTPADRLSALVALRRDLAAVRGEDATLDWDD